MSALEGAPLNLPRQRDSVRNQAPQPAPHITLCCGSTLLPSLSFHFATDHLLLLYNCFTLASSSSINLIRLGVGLVDASLDGFRFLDLNEDRRVSALERETPEGSDAPRSNCSGLPSSAHMKSIVCTWRASVGGSDLQTSNTRPHHLVERDVASYSQHRLGSLLPIMVTPKLEGVVSCKPAIVHPCYTLSRLSCLPLSCASSPRLFVVATLSSASLASLASLSTTSCR